MMTTSEIQAHLQRRLRDNTDTGSFPAALRLRAMCNAELALANWLHPSYLTELEYLGTAIAVTSGKVELSATNLTKDLLRGQEGILSVKVNGTTGIYLDPIDAPESEDNQYFKGQNQNNRYDVKANYLYVFPVSIATIDIKFLQVPPDMVIGTDKYPTINEAFHVLIIDLAEAECWSMDGKFDQQRTVYLKAMDEINELNAPFKDKEWRKTKWRYVQPQYIPGLQQQ